MRRASLLVACFATLASPAMSQSRPNDGPPIKDEVATAEREVGGERDRVSRVVVVSDPIPVQRTRSLVARSSAKGQISFTIPWQTGIYQ